MALQMKAKKLIIERMEKEQLRLNQEMEDKEAEKMAIQLEIEEQNKQIAEKDS